MNLNPHAIPITPASTLPGIFRQRLAATPDALAYRQYEGGTWRDYSWAATAVLLSRWQAALAAEGLAPGERVALMCRNRLEWMAFDLAAQGLGLVVVPIYTNDRARNVAWILADSGARLLLVESADAWGGLIRRQAPPPGLRRVVSLAPTPTKGPLCAVADWLPAVADTLPWPGPASADDLATIVYTSGTTGRPKGVMLSHRNLLWNVQAALKRFEVRPEDRFLSFLPLSHTFERTVGYYLPLVAGAAVIYARGIPQLAEDLQSQRPTLMISVPRIFERVYGRLRAKVETESRLRRRLFERAVTTGWQGFLHDQGRARWRPRLLLRPLLDRLVGARVRARLGGRLRFTVCGGAALAPEVARLFIGLGIPVVQGYGLTEASPVIAANPLEANVPESVGPPLEGVEIRIAANGELLTRSPSVTAGYWNAPEATHDLVDADGWLHTGDKARLDSQGYVHITGRLKEIIVLANGEKVPPADMENSIALDELVDQVLLLGEGRPYLSALVVPNRAALGHLMEHLHLDPANDSVYADARLREAVLRHVRDHIQGFPGYAEVRRVALVAEPWTPENGLATPTLKLRRRRILARYRRLTEELYVGHG